MFFIEPRTGTKTTLSINRDLKLGRGATANVYRVDLHGKPFAAKIFHSGRIFPSRKIQAMIIAPPDQCLVVRNGLEYPQLAWPLSIILDDLHNEIGFLLPLVDTRESFSLDHYYDLGLFSKLHSRDEAAISYKLEIAKNLSNIISLLHKQGHYFIDLKPQNIRVFKRNHVVSLLDCDGFSIKQGANQFPAEMLSTDYISPEAQRQLTPPSQLGEPQDRYALAVILFQLLNRGTHPFQGIITDPGIILNTNDEKAAAGLYPHSLMPNQKIKPRPQSIHRTWELNTRRLFDRAFTIRGELTRPSAQEWESHFDNLLCSKSLVRCEKHPENLEHMRFRDKACSACYLTGLEKRPEQTRTPITRTKRGQIFGGELGKRTTNYPPPPKTSDGSGVGWLFVVIIFFVGWIFISSSETDIRNSAVTNSSSSSTSTNSSTTGSSVNSAVTNSSSSSTPTNSSTTESSVNLAAQPGFLFYANGRYFGEIKNGKANGIGTKHFSSGDIFDGMFLDDKQEGLGLWTYANGNSYKGQHKNGEFNGRGVFISASGEILERIYKNNELLDEIIISITEAPLESTITKIINYPDGSSYVGEVNVNEQYYGQGIRRFVNGDVYEGNWLGSLPSGQGVYTFANGRVYTGGYLEGRETGRGVLVFGKGEFLGDRYEGGFLHGVFDGRGTYNSAGGKIRRGFWMGGEYKEGPIIPREFLERSNSSSSSPSPTPSVSQTSTSPLSAPSSFDTFREEASSSGVSPEAAEEIINDTRDLVDSGAFSRLEDAYGGISGTELQISQQLDADPQRREIVGKVLVEVILESMEVPIQLDGATILTGISYEVATSAVVYHYTATADLSWMTDEALEDLRDEVEAINPDATCRVSLLLLKQGFDMVYSYRTVAGDEMFRVTRDYEGCQSLGFS